MRVLITGSSGRVGSAVAAFLATHHDVVGIDLVAGPHTAWIGSITDAALIGELMAKVDAVVHTAALHAPHVGVASKDAFIDTNVRGTECVVRAALARGVDKFVYTSTTSLYGAAMVAPNRAVWVTEDLPPVARDIYDETKIAAEQICRDAANAGLACVSLRMSRCFPEPDETIATYRLYRGVDARDVAAAHALALEASFGSFEVFNISAASPFAREECEELFANADRVILRHHEWAGAAFSRRNWTLPKRIDRVYAVDKAVRMLGYQPKHNFESLFPERA